MIRVPFEGIYIVAVARYTARARILSGNDRLPHHVRVRFIVQRRRGDLFLAMKRSGLKNLILK